MAPKFYDEKNSAVKNYKVFKKSLILMTKLRIFFFSSPSCFGEPKY